MVFITRPACSLIRPSSARTLSTSAARSAAFSTRASPLLRTGVTSRPALSSKIACSSPSPLRAPVSLGAPASTRLLTSSREKVKVLAVLYDGGQHAKDVSQPDSHCSLTVVTKYPSRNLRNPETIEATNAIPPPPSPPLIPTTRGLVATGDGKSITRAVHWQKAPLVYPQL